MRIFFLGGDFDIFEVFLERIARVVQLLNEFDLVVLGVRIESSSQHDHLYLISFVAGKRKGK